MKKLLIVANWKMNQTLSSAESFLKDFLEPAKALKHNIVIAPSFTLLGYLKDKIQGTPIILGAQNMFFADSGAFTGEISAQMLKDYCVEYVILGHSERRRYFLETDSLTNKKVLSALKQNLKPIICVGETEEQKNNGASYELIKEQVLDGLEGVKQEELEKIVIAYEPVWAIGTGQAATSEDASKMANYIVKIVQTAYNSSVKVKVIYGGSVTEENANEFFSKTNIAGALVGSASLNAQKFLKLIAG